MTLSRPLLPLAPIVTLWLLLPQLAAQELTLEFQLLRMKREVADFLEKRLLEGGDPAIEAERKLPGLITARTIESVTSHRFKCKENRRTESRSSPDDIKLEGGETIPDGFLFEVEPLTGADGTVHLTFFATHAIASPQTPPHILRVLNSVSLYPDQLNFLQRCSTPAGELVLIVKPSPPENAAPSATPGSLFKTIHASAKLYKLADVAARDALLERAKQDLAGAESALAKDGILIDAVGAPVTSGQRQEVRSFVPDFEEAEGMVYEDGTNLQFELTAGPAGQRIDVIADLAHHSATGKRTRADGGERTDQRRGIHCNAKQEIAAGDLSLFPCDEEFVPGGGVRQPAPYILALRSRCYGEFADPPSPRSPIPAGDPAATVSRVYAVPPSFLRLLQEKNLKPPNAQAGLIRRATAKEILEASGIDFPERTRAVFIAQKSELVMLHNRAAHQKLEELLAMHP